MSISTASPPNPWRRFTAAYARLLTFLLAASVALLIVPVTLQIISRYTALIPSYIWTEEMARFMFIWLVLIGAMVGVRESSHFEVDVWPTLSRRSEAAVRIVATGEALLAPAITRAVIEEFVRQRPAAAPAAPPVAELTPREREVLDLLARGLSNPEICERLVISEATTKTHVARILQKLDLRDRVQTVIYAYESGLVTPGYSE